MNKLAIVIPFFKIDFFKETLLSIEKQTNQQFSLYIGNDNSLDDPRELIHQHLADVDYQYYHYEDNLGGKDLAQQWERILENVKEPWFQILGDDDFLAPNFVEEFYRNIDDFEEKYTVVRAQRESLNKAKVHNKNEIIEAQEIHSVTLFKMGYLGETVTSLSEFVFKTEKYRKHGFVHFPMAWGTDVMAFLQWSDFGNIYILKNTLVYIHVFDKSITGSSQNTALKQLAFNQLREMLLNKFAHHLPNALKELIVKDYFAQCWYYRKKSKLNLLKIYLCQYQFTKFLKSLVKVYRLNVNAKINHE